MSQDSAFLRPIIEGLAESTANKLDGAGSYAERHDVKTDDRRIDDPVPRRVSGNLSRGAEAKLVPAGAGRAPRTPFIWMRL